jgi:hypothetical protein
MRKPLLYAVATIVATATLGIATPFTNGDFESPGGVGVTVFLPNGSTFVTGWTHGGNEQGEFYTTAGVWGISAGDGTHYIGWGASGAINGTMSQTFDTVAGTTYNVNYLLTTQQLTGTLPIESNVVQALDGATVLNSVTNDFNQAAGIWNSGATLSFVATSASTTLLFTDTTTGANSGPINWGLDAVTVDGVNPVGTPGAPEPATYGLIGLGLTVLTDCRKKF